MTLALILLISFWPGNAQPETWVCRNDIEIRCDSDGCKSEKEGAFTPMSVDFSDSGAMSVCAYTGCWEGTGKVFEIAGFLVLAGTDLSFSTAKDNKSINENILIALDRNDKVALLKAGSFSQPLVCRQK